MTRSSSRPLIGVSACLKENGRGGWHHTVGEKYVQAALRAAGGLPVLIPAIGPEFDDEPGFLEAMDRLLDSLDGVLLTGSPSNVEPHHYGKESREGTLHDRARDSTTLPLIRHTIDRGVPLFAICRGLQEVNVALGGSLHQHVHEVEGRRDHRSPKSPDMDVNYAPAHEIDIAEGGMLQQLLGERRVTGELAACTGRRRAGAARSCRGDLLRGRPGRGAERARRAGLRARPAMAPRIQGARESGVDEAVRCLLRRLPCAHGGAVGRRLLRAAE
jgi:putative glutamine amidotransferase